MQKLPFVLAAAVVVGFMAVGSTFAQTFPFPETTEEEQTLAIPELSGTPNPLRITASNVSWNGSGSVDIPITLSQRARVWIAVYEIGSNVTGITGPNGSVQRFQAQDLFLNVVPNESGAALEAGNNVVTWDGRDWQGNAVGPGNYEFDVIGMNNLDKLVWMGVAPRTGFIDPSIDMRKDPPENWTTEADEPLFGLEVGNVARAVFGTDFVANPNGWERWDFHSKIPWEGDKKSDGGIRPDPDDEEIFWMVVSRPDPGPAILKLKINRAGKTWDLVTDWADNGVMFSTAQGRMNERIKVLEIYQGKLYNANNTSGEPPTGSVQIWDKATGNFLQEFDVTEFHQWINVDADGNTTFTLRGPDQIVVDESGIVVHGHGAQWFLKIDHNGDPIWTNGPGDLYGDVIPDELAAQFGLPHGIFAALTRQAVDLTGKLTLGSNSSGILGQAYDGYSRDGSGMFRVFLDKTQGPFIKASGGKMVFVQNNRSRVGGDPYEGRNAGQPGPWDGLYVNGQLGFDGNRRLSESGDFFPPTMLMHMPFDIQTRRLGAGVTVVEEVESAGTPDSYSLNQAYPNPFNPATTIEFTVPPGAAGLVKIEVYNAAGQRVAKLVEETLSAGAYKTVWEGRDQSGQAVSSGTYFYRMEAGDFSATHSMTLLK
jgi:hypothetical protein